MYILVSIADVVQLHPSDFHKASRRAIEDWLNAKYADKVIHKVGLCVGFHSLIKASEGLIGHGTGIVNVNVDFRVVVFRPFKGEIIRGVISASTENGMQMSTGFFEDVVVPKEWLFSVSDFESEDGAPPVWIWRTNDMSLYFDKLERCLMRVESEEWTDMSPQMKRPDDFDTERLDQYNMRTGPYRIMASMMHTGLGVAAWWLGEDAAAIEEDGS
ncbi:hypothetical protein BAUCODRAFT_141757 [Baudoinia panamericana UAMH 10762]|uniref:DNA-directed RNA polymerase subunit n=1 Tax=Baudoinia panamericana (strain UAMH 10762) TaxID=717646 RepID=M2MP43_BAUPA|nr:uncharacterized protein BAUCODRAFT_141757 [Baudoinia panamericana UAMH 10762]EMC93248.1 hypothetical protein BAUCODRAFT_141757 [Baudoinia panamericana UAMH 10762]